MASVLGVADPDADAPTTETWCWSPPNVLEDNLVDVEDEDFDPGSLTNFIQHILDNPRTAKKKKIRTTLKHVGRFNFISILSSSRILAFFLLLILLVYLGR